MLGPFLLRQAVTGEGIDRELWQNNASAARLALRLHQRKLALLLTRLPRHSLQCPPSPQPPAVQVNILPGQPKGLSQA